MSGGHTVEHQGFAAGGAPAQGQFGAAAAAGGRSRGVCFDFQKGQVQDLVLITIAILREPLLARLSESLSRYIYIYIYKIGRAHV